MLRAALLCLLVAACSPAPSLRPRLPRRIVGGEPVDISQFPWQVSMLSYGRHYCGASIISSKWTLTAAHCMKSPYLKPAIRAGSSFRNSGGTVYDVFTYLLHSNYDSRTTDYDIGVMQIVGSFSWGPNVQTVCLGTTEPAAGTEVTVTGWGLLQFPGSMPHQLQAVNTSIVSRAFCKLAHSVRGREVTERMICTGEEEGGKGACTGDSGGPLVVGHRQYGIVSWGYKCAQPEFPSVYANVAYLFDWIIEQTGVINCKF